jgi:hypothetical protein
LGLPGTVEDAENVSFVTQTYSGKLTKVPLNSQRFGSGGEKIERSACGLFYPPPLVGLWKVELKSFHITGNDNNNNMIRHCL